jgi:hypothetical protein
LVCTLVSSAIKNNCNPKNIDLIVRIFNRLSSSTKFHYIGAFEKTGNTLGAVAYLTQSKLCAAKPQYYYQNYALIEVKEQNYSVLKLDHARIIGSSNIVFLCSGSVLYEPFLHDEENKWDYTDSCVIQQFDRSFLLKYRDSKKVVPSGIMLSGNYSYNYYHFILEFLTKFFLVDKVDIPADVPIIVDDVVKNIPQYKELLSYFNTSNREIFFIRPQYSYDVESLYYPSFLNIIPPNFRDINDIIFSDCLFDSDSINFLRDTLLPRMVAANSKKRIFLSRQNASSRRSYNESDVVKIFEKYDFQVVCPENYSIMEQIYMFNNATFIAGVTGGAFTNILFCNHGCKILCITQVQNELSIFSTIAKYLGLDLQYLAAFEKKYEAQSLHEEFVIEPSMVEKALIDFMGR